jgi:hypothetical protein
MGLSKREVLIYGNTHGLLRPYLGLWHTIAVNLSPAETWKENIISPIGTTDILGQDFSPAEHIHTHSRGYRWV